MNETAPALTPLQRQIMSAILERDPAAPAAVIVLPRRIGKGVPAKQGRTR